MSSSWLYGLVLLSAVGHATWNAWVKGSGNRLLMMASIRVVGLIFGLCLAPFVPLPDPKSWGALGLAVLALYAYHALLLQSHRFGDLSLVYPLSRGLAPVLLAGAAWVLIGEPLTSWEAFAIALTSTGIMMLVLGKRSDWTAILFAAATGLSIATYTFLSGVAVRAAGTVLGYDAWQEILCGIGVIGYAWKQERAAIPAFIRASWKRGLAAGAISVAGYLALMFAIQVLPMGPIAALRESSVLFGALIGTFALKEPFGKRRLAAAVLVTAGIIVLGVVR